jgi:aryl-alcohol dehydrogenase-like predicted oxidoreductase
LPRFSKENREANQTVVDLIKKIGTEHKATPAQIALAWLLAQKPWITPIPGTSKLHRLEENVGGTNVILTNDDLSDIQQALDGISIQGDRYPASFASTGGK